MARILIVYESKYGQTEKIARFMSEGMIKQGHSVDLMSVSGKNVRSPLNYDGIVIGAGIYMRRYPRALVKWVHDNSRVLNKKTTAFFSVCLAVMQNDRMAQRDLQTIENNFFKVTNWIPKRRGVFAGALSYSKYGWLTKQIMKGIARVRGGDTDTSRDYEYTSWNDVVRFSDNFLKSLLTAGETGVEMRAPL
ncbi:MAG: flavodoxin domain-containing protein [Pseudobdellovibrionaceae bacterium]